MPYNFTMLAQNGNNDYVLQASLCAMSIAASNPGSKVCLITNDVVPDKYKQFFDEILEIPWGDKAKKSTWKVGNRWKIYHTTPYDNSIVLDTDMLVLSNIDNWKEFLNKKELFFVNKVKNYRGEWANTTFYRKTFIDNNLPNLYSGFHFFKKCNFSHEFYTWLEEVMNNWDLFQAQWLKRGYIQKNVSVDVSAAIVTNIMDCESSITSAIDYPTFTHMKLNCQGWAQSISNRWQDRVGSYLTDSLELSIGSYRQQGIFHYTEKDFVTDEILKIYERFHNV